LVTDDDIADVIDAAFEFFAPDRSARQPVGGHDVIHQEAVDVLESGFFIEVAGQQVGVPRLRAPIAADKKVVSLLRGDQSDVFRLRLGTFANAAGDSHFDLVRRADSLIAIFDSNGEADGVLHAVAAPGCTDAALDRAQSLAVRVTAFEASIYQHLPNVGQVLHLRAEHVDPLAAGDFGIQAKSLGHIGNHAQLLRGDFAAGHSRDHGI